MSWYLLKKFNKHINSMKDRKIIKITRDKLGLGRSRIGHPRKRWTNNITQNMGRFVETGLPTDSVCARNGRRAKLIRCMAAF